MHIGLDVPTPVLTRSFGVAVANEGSKQEPATPARPRTWSERLQLSVAVVLRALVATVAAGTGLALAHLVVAALSGDDPNASPGLTLVSLVFAPGPILLLLAVGYELSTRALRLFGLGGWFEGMFARYAPGAIFAAPRSSRDWLHRGLAAWLAMAAVLPCCLFGILLSAAIFMRATGIGPDDRTYSLFLMLLVLAAGIVVCGTLGYVLLMVVLRLLGLDGWFERYSPRFVPSGRFGRWLDRADKRFHARLHRWIPRRE
ncbi:MAG TPA: hypothetical protein VFL14_02980 [Xanthomonadales bacterium]|nr:hypothetical protein [Xanthomonadales bacterium]